MDLGKELLSDFQVYDKYARYIDSLKRREVWEEIVDRNLEMNLKKYKKKGIDKDIKEAYKYVKEKKVLPSMRSMQFAGKAIEVGNNRIYNCGYLPVDHLKAFSELMFLALGGSGIGYSVQKHHVEKLPSINKANKRRRFLVQDSKIGWADAVKYLLKGYFGESKTIPDFDYSDIRAKGTRLVTSGGKAPGPQPLKDCIHHIEGILQYKPNGSNLTPLEAHDIMCRIGDAVLSGGIRRTALISLFSKDDMDMMTCKTGNWWETHPHRARANNSVVLLRNSTSIEDFFEIWKISKNSGFGEPGVFWTDDVEMMTNPCVEASLRAFQFCNLSNVNVSNVETQEELEDRCRIAARIGTLQAGFTDFHYLREEWKKSTEKDALIGVGLTGVASGNALKLNIKKAADVVLEENERIANIIGINKAARCTLAKPDGNSSVLLGTSPGVHAWYDKYFIRRVIVTKSNSVYDFLMKHVPDLMEDSITKPHLEAILSIPLKAPENATTREESAIHLLSRVSFLHDNWIKPGHRSGENTHNISCTVSIKDNEWDEVGEWFWMNRYKYNGLSLLNHSDHKYKQAPYESICEETYKKMYSKLKKLDFTKIKEFDDNTSLNHEIACAGGSCEL